MSDTKSDKKDLAAEELMRQLQNDPEHLARVKRLEEQRSDSLDRTRLALAPVIRDLREAGLTVGSLDELRRKKTNYNTAIPTLLKWLSRVADEGAKNSIVRALSVPWARPIAAPPLIAEFRRTPESESGLKWAIANALSVTADDMVFSDIVELVSDRQHGKSREMLALALSNMTDTHAIDVLIELLNDDLVAGHAITALGKLKAYKARPSIERCLTHPQAWIRRKAEKTLAELT
jgi:hypothetical protein